MNQPLNTSATCFGKLPSRGDFVKGPGHFQLIGLLDKWVSGAMARLSDDPRWKSEYDCALPLDFAFVGARSRVSIVGHLRPSSDASGRRFPFMTAATVEREDTLMFRCAPVGLARSYGAMRAVAEQALSGTDIARIVELLAELNCADDFESALKADPLGQFVRHTTLEATAQLLGPAASAEQLRRSILATGILLRPALGNPALPIGKDLVFPLPPEGRQRHLVAGLWLYLVSAFLRNTQIELQILLHESEHGGRMLFGFNGAAPQTLIAALAPDASRDSLIDLCNPEWIDTHAAISADYGVAKLASYLARPGLSLEAIIKTFREVFFGE